MRFSFAFMILGIIVSVGILSAGLNLFEGYEQTLKAILLDSMSHISIHDVTADYLSEPDAQELVSQLSQNKDISAVYPMLTSSVMVSGNGNVRGCQLKAYQTDGMKAPYAKYVSEGSAELSDNHVIIGYYLARELSLAMGDTLQVVYPNLDRITPLGFYPSSRNFIISGIYQSGYYEYDRSLIISTKASADELLLTRGKFSYLEVRLNPAQIEKADAISRDMERSLGMSFIAIPWTVYNQGLFRLIMVQKWLIFIVFCFMVLIAGLNVVSA
ncbi:MAG: ABC transporter permease, partial [Candidatus Cloacimonadaceae bacterium]|nr:ABC transporter permease [Candidatus Cloacimonadaceae bacterium]